MDEAALKAASIPMQVVGGVAVAANLLVVAVFARTKKLRVKYYGFLFNLVLADILLPLTTAVLIHARHTTLVVALTRTSLLAGQLSILAVAVNRLLALSIVPPARYDAIVTRGRMVVVCIMIWVVAVVVFFPLSYLESPNVNWLTQSLIPIAILLITGILYIVVFRKIAKYQLPLASTPGVRDDDEQTRTRLRQTRHFMITFTVILVAFAVCWLPFCAGFFVLYSHGKVVTSVVIYLRYSYAFMVLNSALNPFIYWWRIRECREGLYELVCVCCGRGADQGSVREQTETASTNVDKTSGINQSPTSCSRIISVT